MTPQEETVILEARDILGRYLSQNPVIGVSVRSDRYRFQRHGSSSSTLVIL